MCFQPNKLNRRIFLRKTLTFSGTSLALLTGCDFGYYDPPETPPPNNPPTQQSTTGCYSSSQQAMSASQFGCGILESFGDPTFDRQFSEEVSIQTQFWGLPAQVYIFDECAGSKNALSHPDRYILFGIRLTVDTIIQTGSSLPIAGILAHEWAHQAQFAHNWINPTASTARNTELEADAFAGYYMGLAKNWAGAELESFFQILFSLGDYDFNNPNHHGTPNERRSAGALGMLVAYEVLKQGQLLSYDELHYIFVNQLYNQTILNSLANPPISTPQANLVTSGIDSSFLEQIKANEVSLNQIQGLAFTRSYRESLFPSKTL